MPVGHRGGGSAAARLPRIGHTDVLDTAHTEYPRRAHGSDGLVANARGPVRGRGGGTAVVARRCRGVGLGCIAHACEGLLCVVACVLVKVVRCCTALRAKVKSGIRAIWAGLLTSCISFARPAGVRHGTWG